MVPSILEDYGDVLLQAPRRSANKDEQWQRTDHHNGLAPSEHSFSVHLLVIDIIATGCAGAFLDL